MLKNRSDRSRRTNMNRDELAQKRIETAIAMNEAVSVNVVYPGATTSESPFAYELLKEDTEERYNACEAQYTIILEKDNRLEDVLNEQGLRLYLAVLRKVEAQEFKNVLVPYAVEFGHSGMWHCNKKSPFFDAKEGVCAFLNTFRNKLVVGYVKEMNKILSTSACIFVTEEWCYTRSGSLYKLEGEQTELSAVNAAVVRDNQNKAL